MLSFEQCFIYFCSFPLLFEFVVGGLGFEFCVFVAGWRHALRSEWPFMIISSSIVIIINHMPSGCWYYPHHPHWMTHAATAPTATSGCWYSPQHPHWMTHAATAPTATSGCWYSPPFPFFIMCCLQSAIIWVFPRALFDATVHDSCICFV